MILLALSDSALSDPVSTVIRSFATNERGHNIQVDALPKWMPYPSGYRIQQGRGLDLNINHEIRLDIMDAGTELNHDDLREKVHDLAKDGPGYAEIAGALNVSEDSVAKAVTTAGPKFQRLQMKIVEHLSDYEVEERRSFVLRLKD